MNTGGKKNCKYYDGTNNNLHLIRGRVVRCLKLGGYIWALGHTRVVCAIVCTNGNCKGTRFLKQLDHNLQRCCSYEVSQYRFLLN